MDFSYSDKVAALRKRVNEFMSEVILPAESAHKEEVQANRRAGNRGCIPRP